MSNVTSILSQIEAGDPAAAELLLPLVYDELRNLAATRLAHEKPGQTLQATALVHEAYLRLVGSDKGRRQKDEGGRRTDDEPVHSSAFIPHPSPTPSFSSRGHFFAAAAEAMRRILVESARRKQRDKHGGQWTQTAIEPDAFPGAEPQDPLLILAIHEALDRLAQKHPRKAELVKLRYFLGCTLPEAAKVLGVAPATAEEDWTYAKAWLRREWLRGQTEKTKS